MARTEYTDEQKAAYKARQAAAKKKTGSSRKSGTTASRARGRRPGKPKGKKRSKCSMVHSYTLRATGKVVNRVKISAYRIDKNFGYQTLVAYVGANDGVPKSDRADVRERFVNMVVTLRSKAGKSTVNGLWDSLYGKLKLIELGLVANPTAPNGGYFGPGGSRLKDKATK